MKTPIATTPRPSAIDAAALEPRCSVRQRVSTRGSRDEAACDRLRLNVVRSVYPPRHLDLYCHMDMGNEDSCKAPTVSYYSEL